MYVPKVLVQMLTKMTVAGLLEEELRVKRLSSTVRKEIYQILGLLIKLLPESLGDMAEKLVPRLIRILNEEVTKRSVPEIPVVTGTLKGLYHAMVVYPLAPAQGRYHIS